MASVLNEAYFHDEAAAFEALEAIVWPNGPSCPHCGAVDRLNRLANQRSKASKKHPEGIERHGLWKCYHCRGQFTVRKGTVFEASHLKLHQWFQVAYFLCSSKKGISSNQLARTLGVTVKTAWFASHRLREAMRQGKLAPMGGAGEVVEADETYFGDKDVVTKRTKRGKTTHSSKRSIVALVQRGGSVRAFHVDHADQPTVGRIMNANIARETEIHTDESRLYGHVQHYFAGHHTVVHSGEEYVRYEGERTVHTNTIEGYFSIFKRGMKGVYQHCGEQHLHRYLAEFDFRYNHRVRLGINDSARTTTALRGIVGKRLMYRDS
jgi:transposase-like protein